MVDCIVIGAGPAGLTAAYELARLGRSAVVFEQDEVVGGLARTHEYRGYRFDVGGHRFFTKLERVQDLWDEWLGDELLLRPRLSRIYYDGKFFDYPLRPLNALVGLGPVEALRIGASYLRARLLPEREERTFEQWVVNRFGRRLFEIFFESYTEKVWGMPCSEIGADWAAQRIRNLDLTRAVLNALVGSRARDKSEITTTLIDSFHYPRFGPGQMWERCVERLKDHGTETVLGARVVRLLHADGRVRRVVVRHRDGAELEVEAEHFLLSMPIRELVRALDPPAPAAVRSASERLRYRDFLTVGLILDRADLFPDNWIYVHTPEVQVGRIQNFKNWSPAMVPDASKSSLGLEYFVQEGDALWSASDEELVELGRREIEQLGLARADEVLDGTVIRMPKAYPVYEGSYREDLGTIRAWLDGLRNLQLIGRNGQHRYNNQDHSMLTAILAAQNVAAGTNHDVWDVNVDEEYHEAGRGAGLRRTPGATTDDTLEELVREAFARFDRLALGGAVGVVAGLVLLVATLVPLLRGDDSMAPMLSLLGNYLVGYQATWSGVWLGLAEAGVAGFAAGFGLAHCLNLVIRSEERALQRRIEAASVDLLTGEAG